MQFHIKNQQGQLIGVADVETSRDAFMEGSFVPSPEFAPYAPMFRALEQACADPSPLAADRLRRDIAGHGLRATGPLPLPASAAIEDVTIQGPRIRFRLAEPGPSHHQATRPVAPKASA